MRCTLSSLRRAVPGVKASQFFAAQRAVILQDLASNANDLSLAGRVDPQIAPLVDFINTHFEQYVTSSSCSGRVALFHRGEMEVNPEGSGVAVMTAAASEITAAVGFSKDVKGSVDARKDRKRGSFGRGTLFQSHEPLLDVAAVVHDQLVPALTAFWRWRQQFPLRTTATARTELLQLKFEPMIIHILCCNEEAASVLLQCAREAAQGKSGIISCSRGTQAQRKITCCVTSPLTFDIPLFSDGTWLLPVAAGWEAVSSGGGMDGFLGEAWQQLLTQSITHANTLFAENARRTRRFRDEVGKRGIPVAKKPRLTEPPARRI